MVTGRTVAPTKPPRDSKRSLVLLLLLLNASELPQLCAADTEERLHVRLVQGFESPAIFDKRDGVSHMSGVPEEAEVEFWNDAAFDRRKLDANRCQSRWTITNKHLREGRQALRVTLTSPSECLRVSLQNNINFRGKNPPPANSLAFFDYLEGSIYCDSRNGAELEMRLLGGFALTDRTLWPALVRKLRLKHGWNRFVIGSDEAGAALSDPHDPAAVEFRAVKPLNQPLTFDAFRMVAAGLGPALARHGRCFDFGVRRYLQPGFLYGSVPYDARRGYGFISGEHLTHGGDFHISDDALTRDGFYAPAAFKLKLPRGTYRVRAQTGNYWGKRDSNTDLEIVAEGRRVFRKPKRTREESIHHKYYAEAALDIDRPDYNLWGNYEQGLNHRAFTFDVEVKDGALELEWKGINPPKGGIGRTSTWTALVVYPSEKATAVEKDLADLDARIRGKYNRVVHPQFGRMFALYNREEAIVAEEYLWPDLVTQRREKLSITDEAIRRGYLHFLRHRHEHITPHSYPLPNETGDALAAFGVPGELVCLQVGLYPLKDLGPVSLRMLTLDRVGGGAHVSRDDMDVRLVSYRCITPVTSNHAETSHTVGPGVLIHSKGVMLRKDYPRGFHVAIRLPESLPPGKYSGAAEIRSGGRTLSTVNVRLRVLPIKLTEPQGVSFAATRKWGNIPVLNFWARRYPDRFTDSYPELELLRSWGINSLWHKGTDGLEDMRSWGKRYDLSVIPEPDRRKLWRWIFPESCSAAEARRQQLAGKILAYNCGAEEGRHQRFTWGYYLWRSSIRNRILLIKPNACERVYYAHAGHQKFGPGAYLFSTERFGHFNFSPAMYEVAEGILDYRYLSTLEQAIRNAPADKKTLANEATAFLRNLRSAISPDLSSYYFRRKRNFNHVGRWGVRESIWAGRRYDIQRWEIAARIMLLTGKDVALEPVRPRPQNERGVVYYRESFGPRFKGDGAYWRDSIGSAANDPDSVVHAETPTVTTTDPMAQFIIYVPDRMRSLIWFVILRSGQEEKLRIRGIGPLAGIKNRVIMNLSGLRAGTYVAEFRAYDKTRKLVARSAEDIMVVPGY